MNKEEIMRQIDEQKANIMSEVDDDRNAKTHIGNQIAVAGDPSLLPDAPEEDSTNLVEDTWEGLKVFKYYNDEFRKGLWRGGLQSVTTASSFIGDITGWDWLKDTSDNGEKHLDKILSTTSELGDFAESGGRVVAGALVTRGLGSTLLSSAGKGALIDFFAFRGKEANIADMVDIGTNNIADFFRTNLTDSEFVQRAKNAGSGALLGGTVDIGMSLLKYGKKLFIAKGKKFEGSDEELVNYVEGLIKDDIDTLEQNLAKVAPDVTAKETTETITLNEGDVLLEEANNFINKVEDGLEVDLKQPLNAEKIAPEGTTTFAKTTQDIESTFETQTFEETSTKIDEALREKIGSENFNLMEDMLKTAEGVENLTSDLGQARVIVGTLAKALDDSIKKAQVTQNPSDILEVIFNMKNLKVTSTMLKNTQSTIAQAMSSMRMSTANSNMMGTLKLLDAIDPEASMIRIQNSMKQGDVEDLKKFIDNLNDTTKGLKDKVENISDSLYTKITNTISETVVAGMLSAPSTLAVNVIGNSLVKHQRMIQDTAQFIWGQVTRSSDRMSAKTYTNVMYANVGHNILDIGKVLKNLYAWGKSGFKDEVFDNAILAKFKQDQDFAHKYMDSKYWRGKEKGQGGFFNGVINITGKLARSPYNIIGSVDDYYKRGAFRAELTRQGGALADAQGLKGGEHFKFINEFIKTNTDLKMIINKGKKPTKKWKEINKKFIGTGSGLSKYSDIATENANYMTFQKELGEGFVGKSVNVMNSDGLLRTLVPFKLTPINILKHSTSTAFAPLVQTLNGELLKGGLRRDIALAKITTSVGILYLLGSMATSGHMTGTFSAEERGTMQNAGIPSLSYRIGDKWFEYKQVEPFATIAGIMADLHRLKTNLDYRLQDASVIDRVNEEYMSIVADIGMSLVHNITDKTYAKSLAEMLEVASGNTSLVNYSGKLISSFTPLSSLTNYIGRVTNDGAKKEASTFMEKIQSKYRGLLDRDALDLFGRPIKETDYLAYATVKVFEANRPEDAGAREVARLGIMMKPMSKSVSFKGHSVKLNEEQYHKMRSSLHTKFNLEAKLNKQLTYSSYKASNDFTRKMKLQRIIQKYRQSASKLILKDLELQSGIKKSAKLKSIQSKRGRDDRTTYNDMIIGKVK